MKISTRLYLKTHVNNETEYLEIDIIFLSYQYLNYFKVILLSLLLIETKNDVKYLFNKFYNNLQNSLKVYETLNICELFVKIDNKYEYWERYLLSNHKYQKC